MTESHKNILVTGGYGFIGSNFVRYLYKRYPSYRIYNLDALTYAGNTENLKDIEDAEEELGDNERRYYFVKGDICDAQLIDNLFSKYCFESVAHFAAETHVDRSFLNVSDFVRTNIDGTHLLIKAVRKYNIPRIVHISTDEVYGSVPEGISKEHSLFNPSNPYSTSKACADLLVQSYIRTHKIPALIIRGSNNFGPYQYPEKLVPLTITNLLAGVKIPIHGDGKHVRSWIHVEDFCNAVDIAMQHGPVGSIYNISGEEKTNMEILLEIARILNMDITKYKVHTKDRPGADYRYAADSTKIKRELGWLPHHTIANSIDSIVSWYLTNQTWWRKIKSKREYQDHYLKQSQGKWY